MLHKCDLPVLDLDSPVAFSGSPNIPLKNFVIDDYNRATQTFVLLLRSTDSLSATTYYFCGHRVNKRYGKDLINVDLSRPVFNLPVQLDLFSSEVL
jgi:hypothetical protein